MGQMALPVRRRKQSRGSTELTPSRLGPVEVMDRADYTAADLDAKVDVILGLIPLGLIHVHETLAGTRHARKTNGEVGVRYGANPGSVRMGGQRLAVRVPRVRGSGPRGGS